VLNFPCLKFLCFLRVSMATTATARGLTARSGVVSATAPLRVCPVAAASAVDEFGAYK
jgi:hypothetical protein